MHFLYVGELNVQLFQSVHGRQDAPTGRKPFGRSKVQFSDRTPKGRVIVAHADLIRNAFKTMEACAAQPTGRAQFDRTPATLVTIK